MTVSVRILSGSALVTERPSLLGWLLGRDEHVYVAVPDSHGVWWEIRDERADRPVSWRVQAAIEEARRAAA